jgi:replication factor C large subunit
MIAALFSSIVSSRTDLNSMVEMLNVLSKADVIVGRVSRTRRWSMLRYVNNIIAYGLYSSSRGKEIKYNQYAMPWPVMGPVFARSQTIRKLTSFIAPVMHVSRKTCADFVLPYLVRVIKDEKVDPKDFAVLNFDDQTLAESLAKEMEKAK